MNFIIKRKRNDKMKRKTAVTLLIVFLLAVIGLLGVALAGTQKQLNAYKLDLEGASFTEGKVVEGKTGGVITASNKWVYFEDDAFILDTQATGKSVDEIFCSLHKNGNITSFSGTLFKAKYTKEIIVKDGKTEKSYYLVGDYYITDK